MATKIRKKIKKKEVTPLGIKLKHFRKKNKMSQEDCAREVGCSLKSWVRWETEGTRPLPPYRPIIMKLFPEIKAI